MATSEKPYWAAAGSKRTAYHHRSDCPVLKHSSARSRSQRYVQYHDLDECRVCRPLDGVDPDRIVFALNKDGGGKPVHLCDPDVDEPTPLCGETLKSQTNSYETRPPADVLDSWRLCYYCTGGKIDVDDDRSVETQLRDVLGDEQ